MHFFSPHQMIARPVLRASKLCCRCYATTTSTSPPMLLKIRKDLKLAMQNKDSNRLNVLRSILSQTLNASKTSSPVNTDMQMLALLRKSASASRVASEEFKSAGRLDLAEKEDGQVKIMEEYAGAVEVVGEEEIRRTVRETVERMKADGAKMQMGEVLKKVFSPEIFGDKPVEKGDVAKVVKEILAKP